MLRRESDSHGLFSSGETSDNDCEVRFSFRRARLAFCRVDLDGRKHCSDGV